jgi:two-component system nitrogen regulation response regulator GlnG
MDNLSSILVVDDELSIRESFSLVLGDSYRVFTSESGEAALKTITEQKIDLIFLDIRMPGMDGVETLRRLKTLKKDIDVVMVTAINDVKTAAEATRLGAYAYILKPFDTERLKNLADDIIKKRQLVYLTRMIQQNAKEEIESAAELVGQSRQILELREQINRLSEEMSAVLIEGASGTKKENCARRIHMESARSHYPFVSYAAVRGLSLEQARRDLFGLGGVMLLIGHLEEANLGTLYIENFENLPVALQDELMEVYEQRAMHRVGASSLLDLDLRIIFGTEEDLDELFNRGALCKSLFLAVRDSRLKLPPLLQRAEDIPLITAALLKKLNRDHPRQIQGFTHEANAYLFNYLFAGNETELENTITNLFYTNSQSELFSPLDLPFDFWASNPRGHIDLTEIKKSFETYSAGLT